MATRTLANYLASIPTASPALAAVPALQGGSLVGATLRKPGYLYSLAVNTPGRDITLLDFTAEKTLVNAGVGSTPLLLRPLIHIANSPADPTLAGLTGDIANTEKPFFRLRREWAGFFSVNPFTPTNRGAVANQAAMVALTTAVKYDYCTRTDLSGAVRMFTGTDPTNAAHWVTEATAGYNAGFPKVIIDWGLDDANDPSNLSPGHSPVSVVYWKTTASVNYVDYWCAA